MKRPPAHGSDSGLVTRAAFKAVRLRANPRSGRFDSYPLPPLSPLSTRFSPDKRKAFGKGLVQLEEEGAVQVLFAEVAARRDPILAAVGELQFDLVQARLSAEYGVETRIERLPFHAALLVETTEGGPQPDWDVLSVLHTRDRKGGHVALIEGEWAERRFREKNADVRLSRMA
jgi:peptide chain release factor 3